MNVVIKKLQLRQWRPLVFPGVSRQIMNITANPSKSLFDEKIAVQVKGSTPGRKITICSDMEDDGKAFGALGHFVTDQDGCVDLRTAPSLGGTYIGTDQMGLFWSIQPKPGQAPWTRFMKTDVTTPCVTMLKVFEGHISPPELTAPLASTTVHRSYLSEDVERREINVGRVRGTLFIPRDVGLCPGVIDIYGTIGGNPEHRAAMLASKGFVCLSLPYFAYKDLPKNYDVLEVSYFQEAIKLLLDNPNVLGKSVGVIGNSYGATIALHLAEQCPQVKACVLISTIIQALRSEVTPAGKVVLKYFGLKKLIADGNCHKEIDEDGAICTNLYLPENWEEITNIKINRIPLSTKFLNIHGKDDKAVQVECASKLSRRLSDYGLSVETRLYEKAGHLLEPPYGVPCSKTFAKHIGNLFSWWGGVPEFQIKAEVDMWLSLQRFMHSCLNNDICLKSNT